MSSKNFTYVTLTMDKEKEIITETAINIETKSDQQHNGENLIVTKSDHPTQPHNGKKIDQIIVSQYNEPYAVTYSKKDDSILGWNIEENGQQRPHLYFKLDKSYCIHSFILYKKILVFRRYNCKYLF